MQFRLNILYTLLISFITTGVLHGQYTGGDNGGALTSTVLQANCASTVYPDIFKGGDQNNHPNINFLQANCSPTIYPDIFKGGNNDGYASFYYITPNCGGTPLPDIFKGGNQNSHIAYNLIQANCYSTNYPDIYKGGSESGYSFFTLVQANCFLTTYPVIYKGGIRSGYSRVFKELDCSFVDDALPITLIGFSGSCDDEVELNWATASESNVSHFEVYRSRDGYYWELLTELPASGNSTTTKYYNTTDKINGEVVYYELHSVDFDGESQVYGPLSVSCNNNSISTWSIYPIPATVDATVLINTDEDFEDIMIISDINGRVLQTLPITLTTGANLFKIDMQSFSLGTYFLHLKNNSTKFYPLKFMKSN